MSDERRDRERERARSERDAFGRDRDRSRSPRQRHRSRSPGPEWGAEFGGRRRAPPSSYGAPPPYGGPPGPYHHRGAYGGPPPPPGARHHHGAPPPHHYGAPPPHRGPPPHHYGGGGGGYYGERGGERGGERERGGGGGGYGRSPKPPMLRTFRAFLLAQDSDIELDEAARRYEIYKREFEERVVQQFVAQHADDDWFRARYHPAHARARLRAERADAVAAARRFAARVADGSLCWRLDADRDENAVFAPFLEHDNASVRTPAELEQTKLAADQRAAALAAADLGDGSANNDTPESRAALAAAGAELTREIESRTVHVRGVPSSVRRDALKTVFRSVRGYERMRIAEPSVDRMLQRVWVTYKSREAAEQAASTFNNHPLPLHGAEEGGTFRLSVKLLTPHRVRVRVTPPAASLPERIEADALKARQLVEKLDRDAGVWPPSAAADAVEAAEKAADGDGSDDDANGGGGKKRKTRDDDDGSGSGSGGGGSGDALAAHPLFGDAAFDKRPTEERLDLCIAYLRHVHRFSYYAGEQFETPEELERVRGPIHLRFATARAVELCAPSADAVDEDDADKAENGKLDAAHSVPLADQEWLRKLDERLGQYLVAWSMRHDEEALTGKSLVEKMVDEFVEENCTVMDEDGKARCEVCSKMFRERKYVTKHLRNKHADETARVRDKALVEQSRRNFLADTHRLRPEERGMGKKSPSEFDPHHSSFAGLTVTGVKRNLPAPLPVPADARPDPRASKVRAYRDFDAPAEGAKAIDYGFSDSE